MLCYAARFPGPAAASTGHPSKEYALSLSVTIITQNERDNMAACLASVGFADQVVVVDSGSTDGTVELAQSLGAEVSVQADWQGFGIQKNRALDLATQDWVLSLDADERVSPELQQEMMAQLALHAGSAEAVAFEVPRLTQFCGQWIHHCGWTPDRVLRLFRRGDARFSLDLVHESLQLQRDGIRIVKLKSPLQHFSYPTPEQYWRKLQRYSHDWALQRHARGQTTTITRAALSGLVAFVRSYVFRLGFMDGAVGFVVCTMQAQSAFGKYFELYCMGRPREK